MGDIFGSLEKALGAFSAWVCAALALAAYFIRPEVPSEHRWIATAALWVFALVAAGKVAEGAWKEGRRALTRRSAKRANEKRNAERKEEAEKARARAVAGLDTLSDPEVRLVAKALMGGSPTVYDDLYSPVARGLSQRGLLIPASGAGDTDDWPWTFPDAVWKGIAARRDTLLLRAQAAVSAGSRR